MAMRSWEPGGGIGCQKVSHASCEALSAKVQRGMHERPLVDGLDAAAVDAHEVGGVADVQQERDVEEAAAMHEPGIVVGRCRKPVDQRLAMLASLADVSSSPARQHAARLLKRPSSAMRSLLAEGVDADDLGTRWRPGGLCGLGQGRQGAWRAPCRRRPRRAARRLSRSAVGARRAASCRRALGTSASWVRSALGDGFRRASLAAPGLSAARVPPASKSSNCRP